MFQFRAFPSYAYLIQRTIRRYCLRGFPHSEISGSTDICSSPKLIAACHVLRRLLMPRHSPCALYSLTFVDVDSISFGLLQAAGLIHSVTSPLRVTNACAGLCREGTEERVRRPHRSRLRDLVLLNYAGNQQVTSQNCNCIPTSFQMFHN